MNDSKNKKGRLKMVGTWLISGSLVLLVVGVCFVLLGNHTANTNAVRPSSLNTVQLIASLALVIATVVIAIANIRLVGTAEKSFRKTATSLELARKANKQTAASLELARKANERA